MLAAGTRRARAAPVQGPAVGARRAIGHPGTDVLTGARTRRRTATTGGRLPTMKIVVLREVRAGRDRPTARSLPTTPPTASASTGCCPSSTSTPSSRRCRSSRRRGEGEITRHDGTRRRPGTRCARRCRWAATPRCTSSTTRCTAPTPSRPRWCWPRPRAARRDLDLVVAGWPPRTARMSVVPAMLAERLACRRSTLASELDRRGRQGHDPPRRRRREHDGRGVAARGRVA